MKTRLRFIEGARRAGERCFYPPFGHSDAGFRTLYEGQRSASTSKQGKKGPSAVNVKAL